MKWNPVNYGGIKDIRVAPEKVWLPDIVLFNKFVLFAYKVCSFFFFSAVIL